FRHHVNQYVSELYAFLLNELKKSPETDLWEHFERRTKDNRQTYQSTKDTILRLIEERALQGQNISLVMNINREIYSSNKELLRGCSKAFDTAQQKTIGLGDPDFLLEATNNSEAAPLTDPTRG
ncbi:MAG: hypothetical protein KDD44_07465, partial [Bdellovibrionales bacterium]|nr:hypothetical protein [Bdellovibrionales bacterium]